MSACSKVVHLVEQMEPWLAVSMAQKMAGSSVAASAEPMAEMLAAY